MLARRGNSNGIDVGFTDEKGRTDPRLQNSDTFGSNCVMTFNKIATKRKLIFTAGAHITINGPIEADVQIAISHGATVTVNGDIDPSVVFLFDKNAKLELDRQAPDNVMEQMAFFDNTCSISIPKPKSEMEYSKLRQFGKFAFAESTADMRDITQTHQNNPGP